MSEEYRQIATELMRLFVKHDIPASSVTLSAITRLHIAAGYSKTTDTKAKVLDQVWVNLKQIPAIQVENLKFDLLNRRQVLGNVTEMRKE